MPAGLIIKLRPTGPWRSGPDSGARQRVDPLYHSDSLFAAVTGAMYTLGLRDAWLDATARNSDGPAVRFSSCFPFLGELGFIVPPRSIWPPAAGVPLSASKVRWKSARFVPLPVVAALLRGETLQEERWTVDGASECLLPVGRLGPFRTALRWNAAVDRLTGNAERHATACLEFRQDAGLWAIASFGDDEARARWSEPIRGAFRLLADSGFGGERTRGWGRSTEPEFVEGTLPELILPEVVPLAGPLTPSIPPDVTLDAVALDTVPALPEPSQTAHWLLSLFTPGPNDAVDWTRGNYALVTRGGRIESPAGFGERKKHLRMVTEGSVLVAGETIRGAATNVAPDGFAHPVFRAGFGLSIPLPEQVTA
jgi:CRISPR type III-A-associated RAMP protein Csm4